MFQEVIYVDVRHYDFWWGLYGFTTATNWEDFIFYEKKDDVFVRLGAVCVCSRSYLAHNLTSLEDDPDEKDFVVDIKQFLLSNTLTYHYSYDEPDDEDFHEVAFEAQRNEKGVKPCYVEMWYPGEGVDMHALETCTIAFCEKFLNKQVDTILLKKAPSFEQAATTYKKHAALFNNGPVQVDFTDELVERLAEQWRISKEEVRKILLRSI